MELKITVGRFSITETYEWANIEDIEQQVEEVVTRYVERTPASSSQNTDVPIKFILDKNPIAESPNIYDKQKIIGIINFIFNNQDGNAIG